tara:strand:+ start:329 stop:1132 length:804 start_codon:yes stop_codon:yes gene_type:complete
VNSWLIFSFVGVFVGSLAGLFGIGGGLITVPITFFVLTQLGISDATAIVMAIKSSLAIIILTSTLSVYSHNQISRISWSIVKELGPGVLIGTVLGSFLSTYLPPKVLEIVFTLYVTAVSLKMWFGFSVEANEDQKPSSILNYIVGAIIGIKSAVLGIGGGTISIPYLSWQGVPIHKAVGVSACIGFIIAISGTLTGLFQDTSGYTLPAQTIGFIYIPALIGVGMTGIIFTKIGSKLSYKLPQQKMRKGFALFLMVIALKSASRFLSL